MVRLWRAGAFACRAGATLAVITALLCTGHLQILPEEIQQGRATVYLQFVLLTIDGQTAFE